jgi:hypothetical protein
VQRDVVGFEAADVMRPGAGGDDDEVGGQGGAFVQAHAGGAVGGGGDGVDGDAFAKLRAGVNRGGDVGLRQFAVFDPAIVGQMER